MTKFVKGLVESATKDGSGMSENDSDGEPKPNPMQDGEAGSSDYGMEREGFPMIA